MRICLPLALNVAPGSVVIPCEDSLGAAALCIYKKGDVGNGSVHPTD